MLAEFSSASILCLTHMFGYFWLSFFFSETAQIIKKSRYSIQILFLLTFLIMQTHFLQGSQIIETNNKFIFSAISCKTNIESNIFVPSLEIWRKKLYMLPVEYN